MTLRHFHPSFAARGDSLCLYAARELLFCHNAAHVMFWVWDLWSKSHYTLSIELEKLRSRCRNIRNRLRNLLSSTLFAFRIIQTKLLCFVLVQTKEEAFPIINSLCFQSPDNNNEIWENRNNNSRNSNNSSLDEKESSCRRKLFFAQNWISFNPVKNFLSFFCLFHNKNCEQKKTLYSAPLLMY